MCVQGAFVALALHGILHISARSMISLHFMMTWMSVLWGVGRHEVSVRCSWQVLRLETRLRDLHGTDTVANQRALTTLQQHVVALKEESKVTFDSMHFRLKHVCCSSAMTWALSFRQALEIFVFCKITSDANLNSRLAHLPISTTAWINNCVVARSCWVHRVLGRV